MAFPDLSSLSRLPWGLLLGGAALVGVLWRKSGHKSAAREFPSLAQRLDLTFRASPYKSAIGRIQGELLGRGILVDPDDLRGIRVTFGTKVALDLSLDPRRGRPRNGWVPLDVSARRFQRRFEWAYAAPGNEGILAESKHTAEVLELLDQRTLKSFSVNDDGIVVTFDFGNPPFLPVTLVERIVPLLAAFATDLVNNSKRSALTASIPPTPSELDSDG